MPSVMDERHEEIRSESISSDHLSEKPVLRPLAENTDRVEWLNERFGPFPTNDERHFSSNSRLRLTANVSSSFLILQRHATNGRALET